MISRFISIKHVLQLWSRWVWRIWDHMELKIKLVEVVCTIFNIISCKDITKRSENDNHSAGQDDKMRKLTEHCHFQFQATMWYSHILIYESYSWSQPIMESYQVPVTRKKITEHNQF